MDLTAVKVIWNTILCFPKTRTHYVIIPLLQDSRPYWEYAETGNKDSSFWDEGVDDYGGVEEKCGKD